MTVGVFPANAIRPTSFTFLDAFSNSAICVLFTANAAYMRDLKVVVPADGVASNEAGDRDATLALVRRVLKASTPPSTTIDFDALMAGDD